MRKLSLEEEEFQFLCSAFTSSYIYPHKRRHQMWASRPKTTLTQSVRDVNKWKWCKQLRMMMTLNCGSKNFFFVPAKGCRWSSGRCILLQCETTLRIFSSLFRWKCHRSSPLNHSTEEKHEYRKCHSWLASIMVITHDSVATK